MKAGADPLFRLLTDIGEKNRRIEESESQIVQLESIWRPLSAFV